MEEAKKKEVRWTHRWTENQTKVLLKKILAAVTVDPKCYERPTAQQFYKIQCKDEALDGIRWKLIRGKMRYLKNTYMKALKWKETVGSELYQSDKSQVEARVKSMCPNFDLLNAIFEPILRADPLRFTRVEGQSTFPPRPPPQQTSLVEKNVSTDTKAAEKEVHTSFGENNDWSSDNTDLEDSEFDAAFPPKRMRPNGVHRWTEQQTLVLFEKVQDAIRDDAKKFERPTAQQFYSIHCQDKILDGIDWKMMRGKMAYLKRLYIKARKMRAQMSTELTPKEKAKAEDRLKLICPHYDILGTIFETILPNDPTTMAENDSNSYLPETATMTENDYSTDNTDIEDSQYGSIVPKVERDSDNETHGYHDASTRPSAAKETAIVYTINEAQHNFYDERTEPEHMENSTVFKTQFDLECAKFCVERKKFLSDLQYRKDNKIMSLLRLNLEKDKFEFEKRKFAENQQLRKHEIDTQFEANKLDIEKDERLRRLELEFKYQYTPNHNEKNNY